VLKANGDKRFAVVDAAMNDLMRPAMYEAWHDIVEVEPPTAEAHVYDVVGPVCESGDWLGRDRRLAIREGDLLCRQCGDDFVVLVPDAGQEQSCAAESCLPSGTRWLRPAPNA
jgi:hypothetical protein